MAQKQITTSFEGWTESADVEPHEMPDLRKAFSEEKEVGEFNSWRDKGQKFVERTTYDTIVRLASPAAEQAFARHLGSLPQENEPENGLTETLANPKS